MILEINEVGVGGRILQLVIPAVPPKGAMGVSGRGGPATHPAMRARRRCSPWGPGRRASGACIFSLVQMRTLKVERRGLAWSPWESGSELLPAGSSTD